jgi:protein TonB
VQEARHNPTSAPPSALPHATTKNPVFVIAPESTKAAAPTAQEPIVLAAASSMKHSRSDDDALSAAPQVSAAASAPASNIALPGTSSVPKLTAPVSKTRTGGTLLKRVDPVYPQFAKTAGIHGQVELQYRVNKDGSVDQVRRVSGPAVLASAAIDAVKHWRYDPVKEDGEPVEMQMTVKLNFGLSR